jgi:trans-aconitate methyltransferase
MSDWNAEQYHRLSNPQVLWGRRVLERLAPAAGECILDLGCGTGRLTAELADTLGSGFVIGVDRSESMLRHASTDERLRDRSGSRSLVRAAKDQRALGPHRLEDDGPSVTVHFVRADASSLPFVDTFDAVLSTATFHWIRDHDTLFASIYRALVPGGRLVAQCGGGRNTERLLERTAAFVDARGLVVDFDGRRDPWEFADVPTTIQRLDRAGFTAIDVWLEEAPATLPDRQTYKDFVTNVCVRAHLDQVAPDQRDDLLESLADQAANDSPPFTLDYWRLNIVARKPAGIEQAA